MQRAIDSVAAFVHESVLEKFVKESSKDILAENSSKGENESDLEKS